MKQSLKKQRCVYTIEELANRTSDLSVDTICSVSVFEIDIFFVLAMEWNGTS